MSFATARAGMAARPREVNVRVVVAIAVTTLLWASAFVAIRSARTHFAPAPLALGRVLVGAVALSAMMAFKRPALPGRRELPSIIAFGVLWFGIYNIALNQGERLVDAGTAAMAVNVAPILIAVLASWLLRERLSRWVLGGLGIAFAGAAVIAVSSSSHHGGIGGVLLCLLAAAVYAVAVVMQKPVLARVSPIAVTWGGCLAGALVCLPFAPALVHELRGAPATSTLLVAYLGVGPTAVGFSTWAYALSHSTMARQGATTYLVPPLVIAISWATLGEVPGLIAIAGGVLCLAGVAVTRRRR
ncbi:MAG TPA: DMT family transporter [Solirubrobacteraceae bacterium]|nr:DMT family transporter [Solirubrobacteraceae bacterium]